MTHTPLINIPTAVSLILPVVAPTSLLENHPTHRLRAFREAVRIPEI